MIIYLKILEAIKNFYPFVRRNYKAIAFILITIAAIYLWFRSNHERHRAEDAEKGRDAAIQISNEVSSISHKYRNKQGDTVILTKEIGIPKSQVDDLLKQNDLKWLRKFEGLKKDGSNLQSAETFGTTFQAEKVPEKIKYLPCKDSVKAFAFDLHDQWNDIHALVIDTPKIEIKDRYYGVVELKRPKGWFWKLQWSKKEAFSEITNSNKLVKIDSVISIIVNP